MENEFSEEKYNDMLERLFVRFPTFQRDGISAYKPGLDRMEFADQMLGRPHRRYRTVHVAGTNGKGSVSNMLASVLSASGMKAGLYTSPHILDFRERIRVVTDEGSRCISKEDVWDFMLRWKDTFDHLDLSFFEITTLMAFDWFAGQKVDIAVIETGLGGRLDSTNVITPVLSIITNIGLDHCDLLGNTLPEVAFEKAGIIKPGVPVVVGESDDATSPVFERKVLYTNLPEPEFMGDRTKIMSMLTYADKYEPPMWDIHEDILAAMDLSGSYQDRNLRTVLAALPKIDGIVGGDVARDALVRTAARTGFRGRWEILSDKPLVICDIGHNVHGLKYNFRQLEDMMSEGGFSDLIIVYGTVSDKDVDASVELFPRRAHYVFTQARGKRAMPASDILDRYLSVSREAGTEEVSAVSIPDVADAVEYALNKAGECECPLIYIGGSTYVVSEAVSLKIPIFAGH